MLKLWMVRINEGKEMVETVPTPVHPFKVLLFFDQIISRKAHNHPVHHHLNFFLLKPPM